MSERFVHTVPAAPGFWVHLLDGDEHLDIRQAVLAWVVDLRPQAEEWLSHVDAVTVDGVVKQDHFIEQPDGTCVDVFGSYGNVALAIEAVRAERAEINAVLSKQKPPP